MESYYLNTDLEIKVENLPSGSILTITDFDKLVSVLSDKCVVHMVSNFQDRGDGPYLHFIANANWEGDPNEAKRYKEETDCQWKFEQDCDKMLTVLEQLGERLIKVLQSTTTFDFNIGWQSSEDRPEGWIHLPNKLLKRIADIGATVTMTVYPSNENDSKNW